MTELYSVKDVARIFAVQESRLRYWMQVGFVGPTVRKGGRFYYTFRDLVAVKAAKDLLAAGLPLQKVRKNLQALRDALPGDANPTAKLRICSDGETIVAIDDDVAFEPASRQVVMAVELPALAGRVADVLASGSAPVMSAAPAPAPAPVAEAIPHEVGPDVTAPNGGTAAYRCFLEACAAEDRGDIATAEHLYRQSLELESTLAAAQTNLGNILYRADSTEAARDCYERALELEPNQPEARYNLGNILEDLGETEQAIAELRRVCMATPDFADAHYNLGLMLVRVGGTAQARRHLERYLELDTDSPWAERARETLAQIRRTDD